MGLRQRRARGRASGASGVGARPPLSRRRGRAGTATASDVLDPAKLPVPGRWPGAQPRTSASGIERSDVPGPRCVGALTERGRRRVPGAEPAVAATVGNHPQLRARRCDSGQLQRGTEPSPAVYGGASGLRVQHPTWPSPEWSRPKLNSRWKAGDATLERLGPLCAVAPMPLNGTPIACKAITALTRIASLIREGNRA